MKQEKQRQLGMNPSTAQAKLLKDILFFFVNKEEIKCFQCSGALTRENFSIEHKVPWLHSENPRGLFFDLDNISFSHLSCNYGAARRNYTKAGHGTRAKYESGCKCKPCLAASASYTRSLYTTEKRRIKYEKEKLKYNRK
jgi:hypothetical protein